MLVIHSSLGSTDCSRCRVFNSGTTLFAQRIGQPEFTLLPIKIAEMRNIAAVEEALIRIQHATKTGEDSVELTDLE